MNAVLSMGFFKFGRRQTCGNF